MADVSAPLARVGDERNATDARPSLVRGWLHARAADSGRRDALLEAGVKRPHERAGRDGVEVEVTPESFSAEVAFETALAARISELLGQAPILPTSAGHDAGVLSAHVPTAMLFVRNPTGVSHSPAEHAEEADCVQGIDALARVLVDLT